MPQSITRKTCAAYELKAYEKSITPEKMSTPAYKIELDRWYTYKGAKVRFINVCGRLQPSTNTYSTNSIREATTILQELQALTHNIKISSKIPN